MPPEILPATGYVSLPWKNGTGSTEEILLLPPGAGRDDFALRVSRADIPIAAPFSSFPGVERAITVIEGTGLVLDFGDRQSRLAPEQPFLFDSTLMPVGRPEGGPVRVLNVMAARDRWHLAGAEVSRQAVACNPGPGGLVVVFALRGPLRVESARGTDDDARLGQGDTALLDEPARLTPEGPGGALLRVSLRAVASP